VSVYSISADLAGAVNQVMPYRDGLLKDYRVFVSKWGARDGLAGRGCFVNA
jgi:hypothetical protein